MMPLGINIGDKNVISIRKRSAKPIYKIDMKKSYENCLSHFNTEINALLLANSINVRGLVKGDGF